MVKISSKIDEGVRRKFQDMKKSILEVLDERVIILDGAMGSMLISQGLEPGIPPESWNVQFPDKIKKIHQNYFEAGSDVVLTNTFGGSPLKLEAHGHEESVRKFNIKAVELAKEVCPENCYVAGDIGPSGKFLSPVGTATSNDFDINFLEQAKALEEADVDLFYIETMVDINEAEAAVRAVRKTSDKPIFCSMTFNKTKRGFYTIMGNNVEQCVNTLKRAGANVIGANCTISSKEMVELVPIISNYSDLPVLVKPNAGQPQLVEGITVYDAQPEEFSEDIINMIKADARVVGGCCGSTPEFIKAISTKIKREN